MGIKVKFLIQLIVSIIILGIFLCIFIATNGLGKIFIIPFIAIRCM